MLLCVQRWLNLVLDLMVTALAVIVVALAVNLKSTTAAGLLGIALNNVFGFNKSISTLVTSWTSLETSLGAVARVKTFAEMTPSENKPGENCEPPSEWPASGSIEINCVSATYGTSAPALDEISMSIAPGQKIGICGRTGRSESSIPPSGFSRAVANPHAVAKAPYSSPFSASLISPQAPSPSMASTSAPSPAKSSAKSSQLSHKNHSSFPAPCAPTLTPLASLQTPKSSQR
jgi:hypothetical protein